MPVLTYTIFVFRLRKDSTLALKQLSVKRFSNVVDILCTAETEKARSLMRTLTRIDFKSI